MKITISKNIIIIILIVLIVVMFIGFFFLFKNDTGGGGESREGNFFGIFSGGGSGSGGGSLDNEVVVDEGDQPGDLIQQNEPVAPLLQQLTSTSIAGALATSTTLPNTTVRNTVVRYIDRASGNMFEIDPTSLVEKRITISTLPGIQEVFWHKDGERLLLRYLTDNDIIKSFGAHIVEDTEENLYALEGNFLADDIALISTSPSMEQLLYITPVNNVAVGIISDFNGGNSKVIFSSPFSEWIAEWINEDTIALTTKASAKTTGYLYFVDINKGTFEKVLGNVQGLTTTVSPGTEIVLYAEGESNIIITRTLNTVTHEKKVLSISTLPEKCVWSKTRPYIMYCAIPSLILGNDYPDVWYKGLVSFSDNIWEVDVKQDESRLLVSPVDTARQEIDVVNPFIGPNEEFLFFTNKKDSTLWSLRLNR